MVQIRKLALHKERQIVLCAQETVVTSFRILNHKYWIKVSLLQVFVATQNLFDVVK